MALPAWPGITDAAAAGAGETRVARPTHRPNLLFLITDQERYPQHWPEGWAGRTCPTASGSRTTASPSDRAFCNGRMCSPSRATLFTGLYAAQHGVTEVLQFGGPDRDGSPGPTAQTTLQPGLQNIGRMLLDAGYDVQYRGKWHVSKDPTGTLAVQSPGDLEITASGWIPPEAGTDQEAAVFGGGDTNYDAQYASQAAESSQGPTRSPPGPSPSSSASPTLTTSWAIRAPGT